MAKPKTYPEKPPTNEKFAFVRYELEAVELQALKAWKPTLGELDDAIVGLVELRYKFTIKWDTYNNCYQCSMQTDNKFDPNYNLCLVGRGSSPMRSVKQVLWKHKSCDSVWPTPDFSGKRSAEFDD